jgi:hypothetical protein
MNSTPDLKATESDNTDKATGPQATDQATNQATSQATNQATDQVTNQATNQVTNQAANPDDILVARADERLAHAYGQIARADEQLARVTEQLSRLERDAARQPSAPPIRRSSLDRPALRGGLGLLVAACIFAAAFVSQSSYGNAAKLTIARWWTPQPVEASSLPPEKLELPAQASAPAIQLASADPATPRQATPAAQTPAQDVAPPPAPLPPEVTALLQTMAHDLANVGQELASVKQAIEQLKASQDQFKTSQDQMAGDNARATSDIKASQEQITRLVAKASSEPRLRPGIAAPPPRPISAQPAPTTHPSPQARAQP